MKPDDKAAVMADFVAGKIHVLVATTVIEVGVDVPNASLMAIEHAERFGLAQLHQLRGRVGRGAAESTCYLLFEEPLTDTAKARLKVDLRAHRRLRDRAAGPDHPRPRRIPGREAVGRAAAALRRPRKGRRADRAGARRRGRAAARRSRRPPQPISNAGWADGRSSSRPERAPRGPITGRRAAGSRVAAIAPAACMVGRESLS